MQNYFEDKIFLLTVIDLEKEGRKKDKQATSFRFRFQHYKAENHFKHVAKPATMPIQNQNSGHS